MFSIWPGPEFFMWESFNSSPKHKAVDSPNLKAVAFDKLKVI